MTDNKGINHILQEDVVLEQDVVKEEDVVLGRDIMETEIVAELVMYYDLHSDCARSRLQLTHHNNFI